MAGPYTDPMSFIMQLMGMGNAGVVPPGPPGMMGAEGFPGATGPAPNFAPPPPQPVQAPMPQLPAAMQSPYMGGGPTSGPPVGASPGPVPGQGAGQVPSGMPGGMSPMAQGGGAMDFAALQALQPPENENPGPPQPPAAPGQRPIDPGVLIQALMQLGVHPGQLPQLSQQLKR